MKQRTTITLAQRVKLTDLLREQYVSSGLNDEDFAKLASEKIGATINSTHVMNQRNALDMPNNHRRPKAAEVEQTALAQVAELRELVASLTKRVAALEGDI